jgi:aromatic-L-amino-acid decarboxylase
MVSNMPLDVDGERLRSLLEQTSDFLVQYLAHLPEATVYRQNCKIVQDTRIPEVGQAFGALLETIRAAAEPGSCNASGGFMAYIPNGGLPTSAIADLIANVFNKYTGANFAAPGFAAMERDLLKWLVQIMGFPETGRGILTSGASLATVSALACMRETRAFNDIQRAVIYVTDQTHVALSKAARLVGFARTSLRQISCDANQRMDVAALEHAIRVDRQAGLMPACLVASAGTTNTGVIDPLPAMADVASREGLWLHVDAAYGGFFRLTERGRSKLAGIERADSIVMDPHKSLFLPFGTGCLLVRDEAALRLAHIDDESSYRRDIPVDESVNFSDISPELTRPFRGLRLWLPLHLHGVAAFREALDAKLDLARIVYEALAAMPELEVPAPPDLSIVAFRLRDDEATDQLVATVNSEGRVMLSTTRVAGRAYARVAILGMRTSQAHIETLLQAIRNAVRRGADE